LIKGEFHNVDINLGYERFAKAIVVGGVQQFDYAFLASEQCEDLCLMVDCDRDELVRKLKVVEKREVPYWWKARRLCADCWKPIADWSKTGYCRLCAPNHRNFKSNRYSKGKICPGCNGKMTNYARLCKPCEDERRKCARLDGG